MSSPAAEEPHTTADVMMMTGRMNFSAREPTMNPTTTDRKNWMSPVNGRMDAAAMKASPKHRRKMPAW